MINIIKIIKIIKFSGGGIFYFWADRGPKLLKLLKPGARQNDRYPGDQRFNNFNNSALAGSRWLGLVPSGPGSGTMPGLLRLLKLLKV